MAGYNKTGIYRLDPKTKERLELYKHAGLAAQWVKADRGGTAIISTIRGGITECTKGNLNTAYGYKWAYNLDDLPDEEWRDVADPPVQASNLGRIKHNNVLTYGSDDGKGYKQIMINKKGYRVHRLVGMAFHPNPDDLPEINHKDGNKSNNYFKNLEWSTGSENTQHAFDTGLHTNESLYVPVAQYIKYTNHLLNEYKSITEANEETGIWISDICKCCKGVYKSAGGYSWGYI